MTKHELASEAANAIIATKNAARAQQLAVSSMYTDEDAYYAGGGREPT